MAAVSVKRSIDAPTQIYVSWLINVPLVLSLYKVSLPNIRPSPMTVSDEYGEKAEKSKIIIFFSFLLGYQEFPY